MLRPMPATLLLEATTWQAPMRLVGGLGMLAGVALLLAVPLLLVARASSRRRRRATGIDAPTATIDAWAASGSRLENRR